MDEKAQIENRARDILAQIGEPVDVYKALTEPPPPPELCLYDEAAEVFEIVDPDGGTYEVSLAECRNYRKLVLWLGHLCGKVWFTREVMHDFLERWTLVTGLSIHDDLTTEEQPGENCPTCGLNLAKAIAEERKSRAEFLARFGAGRNRKAAKAT